MVEQARARHVDVQHARRDEPVVLQPRAAFVTHAGVRRDLEPGTALSFGRHEACDVPVGVDDEWVSRRVGEIRMDSDRAVSAALTHSSHVVRVVTPNQAERLLEPRPGDVRQESLGLVWEHAIVVVSGRDNATYPIFVVTGEAPSSGPGSAREQGQSRTTSFHSRLDDRERLLLIALAEPVLRFGQVAEPATYAMIAARLQDRLPAARSALTARMVRRYLEELFDRLTLTERVPGLASDDDQLQDEPEFLSPRVRRLAVWAVSYGVVNIGNLDELP